MTSQKPTRFQFIDYLPKLSALQVPTKPSPDIPHSPFFQLPFMPTTQIPHNSQQTLNLISALLANALRTAQLHLSRLAVTANSIYPPHLS
jgi:hypothetical protein